MSKKEFASRCLQQQQRKKKKKRKKKEKKKIPNPNFIPPSPEHKIPLKVNGYHHSKEFFPLAQNQKERDLSHQEIILMNK